MQAFKAGVAYFALVFAAGFVLGSIRVPLLVPRFGERTAELLEMPVMLVIVIAAARFVVRRFALPLAAGTRLTTGAVALTLLLMCELALAVALRQQTPGAYIASRDPVSGSVYVLSLLLFFAMPLLLALRERRT